MFKALFQPKEIKAALLAVDIVQQRAANSAFALIRNDLHNLLVDHADKVVSSIRENNMQCETLVHVLMTKILAKHLCSGSHHTYRGLLSMRGEHLLNLWDYAVEQLRKSGFYDHEKAASEKQWIRSQIAKAG